MQPTSALFKEIADGPVRKLAWQVRASFTKKFDDDIEFFTLDDSLLDGSDVLAPTSSSVIQLWDKYEYEDITDRVISVEMETEQTEPYSIVRAMADVTVNNFDGYFTPKTSPNIASNNITSAFNSYTNTLSWSHSCSGKNRYLVVGVVILGDSPPPHDLVSVTYDGLDMTYIGDETNAGVRVFLYGLVAPPKGSNTIVVTHDGTLTTSWCLGIAQSFVNVSQSQPTGDTATADDTDNAMSVSLDVPDNNSLAVSFGGKYNTDDLLVGNAGQTNTIEDTVASGWGLVGAMSYKPASDDTTMGYTYSDSNDGCMVGVVLNRYTEAGDFALPRRPFRVLMGFGSEVVPLFVGLSTRTPEINKNSRTAKFHCIDFLTYMFEQKIDNTLLLQDYSTGEILEYLFDHIGLLPSQYEIDPTSFNRISYFYAEKGRTLGEIIRPLMEAEQGALWLNEVGVIRFQNRQSYPTIPVHEFDEANTIDYDVSDESDVINYVEIISKVLGVQPSQNLYQIAGPRSIPAGQSLDIWIDFADPVTGADSPSDELVPIEASYFIQTQDEAGTVPSTDISLDSVSIFSKSMLVQFTNSGSSTRYVYDLVIWGTPVRVTDEIRVEDQDAASIEAFEQRAYRLETNYIQDREDAVSKAAILIRDYKDYGDSVTLDVKGRPDLQIRDIITLNVDGYVGDYVITKIYNGMGNNRYIQRVRATEKDITEYFILDESLLDGSDLLAP